MAPITRVAVQTKNGTDGSPNPLPHKDTGNKRLWAAADGKPHSTTCIP